MKFGPVPLSQAAGAVLAHSYALPKGRLRKGLILQNKHLTILEEIGVESLVVARLEAGDVDEDSAALRLGEALSTPGLRLARATGGRVNLFAESAGVLDVARTQVDALNRIDPAITLATLCEWAETAPGTLIATVKIIAYGVAESALAQACAQAKAALALHQPTRKTASLIQTGQPGALADKGRRALTTRLARFGAHLAQHAIVPHRVETLRDTLTQAQGEILFILTASATSDLRDVAPEALRQAGGKVIHFGLPVDPGNLLFIGELDQRPVIGLPGCARSLALNGADWVTARILCGLSISPDNIAAMGVGGLLKEMPSRPQPREK